MRTIWATTFALLCLFGCSPVWASVSLDNCESAAVALSGTTVTDNGFTVGAGSNQLLVLFVSQGSSAGTTVSATWNGTSLSSAAHLFTTNTQSDILVLKAPTQGNQSLVISNTASFSFSNSIVCSFNGVDQTTPTQNSNTSATTTVAITTANGNATAAAASDSGSFTSFTPGQLYANGSNGTGAAETLSTTSSTTYTLSGSGNIALTGVDIKAAAGGGGGFAAPPCVFIVCIR